MSTMQSTKQSIVNEEIGKLIVSAENDIASLKMKIEETVGNLKIRYQEVQATVQADEEQEKANQDKIKELKAQIKGLTLQNSDIKERKEANIKKIEKYSDILSNWPDNIFQTDASRVFSNIDIATYFNLRYELFRKQKFSVVLDNVLAINELITSTEISEMINKYQLTQIAQMSERNEWFFQQCNTLEVEISKNNDQNKFVVDTKIRSKIMDGTLTEKEAKQYKLEYWVDESAINDIYAKFKDVEQRLINFWTKRFLNYTTVLIEKSKTKSFEILEHFENNLYSQLFQKNPNIDHLDTWIWSFINMFTAFCNKYKFPVCKRCQNALQLSGLLHCNNSEIKITLEPKFHYKDPRFVDVYTCPHN